ncbi:MAG: hypothetical protein Tsb0021_12700 [Chlamydiales bacterium]
MHIYNVNNFHTDIVKENNKTFLQFSNARLQEFHVKIHAREKMGIMGTLIELIDRFFGKAQWVKVQSGDKQFYLNVYSINKNLNLNYEEIRNKSSEDLIKTIRLKAYKVLFANDLESQKLLFLDRDDTSKDFNSDIKAESFFTNNPWKNPSIYTLLKMPKYTYANSTLTHNINENNKYLEYLPFGVLGL